MNYFVYILQSKMDGSFYIGYTSNLSRRLMEHNFGETRYTSKKRPWKIVYSEEYPNKSDAIRREKFLKRQRNKQFYKRLIDGNASP